MSIQQQFLLTAAVLPEPWLEEWLQCQQSMTSKLQAFQPKTSIEVLQMDWRFADWWARHCLALNAGEAIYQREILMQAVDKPCWYARTCIPKSCYDLDKSFFARLESESLNKLLFNEPQVNRGAFVYYPVDASCIEYHWAKAYCQDGEVNCFWVRLSEFIFKQTKAFYLCEILFDRHLKDCI